MNYFEIEFPDGHVAKAIRTSKHVDPEYIANVFQLSVPWSVLLLSGGAGRMSEEHMCAVLSIFSLISEIIVHKRVMVIDGGTKSGVMALMGEALSKADQNVPYIGILPAYAKDEPSGQHGESLLEPHHSHFVLIESDEWGSEINAMCDLATYFSTNAPSLVLLANGGEIALRDIEYNVLQEREIVVLVGSGRLADEIAQAIRNPTYKKCDRIVNLTREGKFSLFDISKPPDRLIEYLKEKFTKL